MAAVECGSLQCQRDSYARSLDTVVVSCTPASAEDRQHGAYAVVLENTVLFPEGGGQVSFFTPRLHSLASKLAPVLAPVAG